MRHDFHYSLGRDGAFSCCVVSCLVRPLQGSAGSVAGSIIRCVAKAFPKMSFGNLLRELRQEERRNNNNITVLRWSSLQKGRQRHILIFEKWIAHADVTRTRRRDARPRLNNGLSFILAKMKIQSNFSPVSLQFRYSQITNNEFDPGNSSMAYFLTCKSLRTRATLQNDRMIPPALPALISMSKGKPPAVNYFLSLTFDLVILILAYARPNFKNFY